MPRRQGKASVLACAPKTVNIYSPGGTIVKSQASQHRRHPQIKQNRPLATPKPKPPQQQPAQSKPAFRPKPANVPKSVNVVNYSGGTTNIKIKTRK